VGGEEQGLYGDATGVFIELGKLSSGDTATETAGMWRCVCGARSGHESECTEDKTDARSTGCSSGGFGDVRAEVIRDEDVARALLCAVVPGEEDDDDVSPLHEF
jgi:hypothetical protein